MRLPTFAVLALAVACRGPAASREDAVIFGEDDRIEVHEVSRAELRDLVIRAVPAMVHRSAIRFEDGIVTLASSPLGPSHDLCDGEAHFDQPSVASCSATLIDDDLVLTAGHCVDSIGCASQRYVFGWYYEAPDVLHTIDFTEVYACAEIVAYSGAGDDDFAIVRLDEIPPGPPADVRLDPVVVGETASLAGFPLGLPMKVVEMGPVTALGRDEVFFARLDAHPGNSGSGVFDAELRVIGELTNGPVDAYVETGTCRRLRVIGEDTTRTETIRSVAAAVEQLCASGYPSTRLCGPRCGDGLCDGGELCELDCGSDAGPIDAGGSDAGPMPAPDTRGDGGMLRIPGGGGCTCSAGRARPSATIGLLAAALAALARSRRSRLRREPSPGGTKLRAES